MRRNEKLQFPKRGYFESFGVLNWIDAWLIRSGLPLLKESFRPIIPEPVDPGQFRSKLRHALYTPGVKDLVNAVVLEPLHATALR